MVILLYTSKTITRRITSMISIEDWVMIKHMHKQGVPKTRIASEL